MYTSLHVQVKKGAYHSITPLPSDGAPLGPFCLSFFCLASSFSSLLSRPTCPYNITSYP